MNQPIEVPCRISVTVRPRCPACQAQFKTVVRVTTQDSAVAMRCRGCGNAWQFVIPPYTELTHGKLVLEATPTSEVPGDLAGGGPDGGVTTPTGFSKETAAKGYSRQGGDGKT